MILTVTTMDDTTIQVERSSAVTTTYTYAYLVTQRQTILDQKQRDSDQRDAEVAEIDRILAHAKSLGVAATTTIVETTAIPSAVEVP